jgi:hypothetical protein
MLQDITSLISPSVHNNGSAGDVGELFVSLVMNHAMDRTKKETADHDFCSIVEVELSHFLSTLCSRPKNRSDNGFGDTPSEVLAGKINFTHFTRSFHVANIEDVSSAAVYYHRAAAAIAPPNYQSIDLFIPVRKETGDFVWLLVQVKNYDVKSSVSFSSISHGVERFYPTLGGSNQSKLKYDGLFLLLNLRAKPDHSRLSITGQWVFEPDVIR